MVRRLTILIWVVLGSLTLYGQAHGQSTKLMIFGGQNHKTYLGCLSCTPEDPESIFNKNGRFGSCRLLEDSIFCRGPLDEYGTKSPIANLSACAPNASNPPVIVDQDGRYYGRFSVGGLLGHKDSVCAILNRFKNDDACALVQLVCDQ
jgi:hypothetical protein